MGEKPPVTIWNLLALVVIVLGVAAALGGGEAWLHYWAGSGQKVRIGDEAQVYLEGGEQLVYYESSQAVPTFNVVLELTGTDGRKLRAIPVIEEISYSLKRGQQHGKALWRVSIPQTAWYTARARNYQVDSDTELPEEDRIVFGKKPETVEGMMSVRRVVQIGFGALGLVLAAALYAVHFMVLKQRRQPQQRASFYRGYPVS